MGGASTSALNDVSIISDTLAYAVGEIYLLDSTGNVDPDAYNLARWDGESWELIRVWFWTVRGDTHKTSYPASAVLAFAPNDVWIGMEGDQVVHWDGETQSEPQFLPSSFQLNKMWGKSSSSFYVVGNGGNIFHYAAGTWESLESGIHLPIRDIWGAPSPISIRNPTGTEILAIASGESPGQESKVLSINGSLVTTLSGGGLPWSLGGIWFAPNQFYCAVGDGIFVAMSSNSTEWSIEPIEVTPYYTSCVRGNAGNDVFIAGSFGELLHYNGSTWHSYIAKTTIASGSFGALAVRGNLVIAVGLSNPRAIAAVGRRF